MIIEMIARQVRKYADVEGQSTNSFLSQRMRRGLHCNGLDAVPIHISEHFLQIDRFGSRVMRGKLTPPVAIVHRSYNTGIEPRSLEDGFDEIRECGFTVSAGDPNNRQPLARAAKKLGGPDRHGAPNVFHSDRCRCFRRNFLVRENDSRGSTTHRIIDIVMSVKSFPRHGKKHSGWTSLSRIVSQSFDFLFEIPVGAFYLVDGKKFSNPHRC